MRSVVRSTCLAGLCAIVVIVAAGSARADDPAALKHDGDEAMLSGRPADALAAYTKAYAVAPSPVLRYNRGRALQALTRFPEALDELEAFRATAPPDLKARVAILDELIADVRSRVATLSLDCGVRGATVRLRDATIGTCPLERVRVNAGQAHLEVSMEGFFSATRDLELKGGTDKHLAIALVPKEKFGLLAVATSVAGANVAVDGAAAGHSPIETRLAPGGHRVEATLDGYRPASTSVVVLAGAEKRVHFEMTREPGLLSRWWFWAIAGGVVAAGAGITTYFAVTSERSAGQGDFGPGIVVTE